ncbi:cytotoxic T-lymphocyte protein 4 [Sceloporus undulatus]|uniref:cytotoxic T-lymphocyte protein 4 n=1 Tax=Sceloporus undulatus TaxID=8520 RepID=UPI001C4D2719|nr:cytotoxic T-lymphocyte protein 4 [Sceloporus undulatus]
MMGLFLTVLFSSIVAGLSKVMEVTQPAFIVAKSQGPVNFPCELKNTGDAKELRMTLLKQRGNESIGICASSLPTEDDNPFSTKEDGIQCQVHPGRESVNVTLWGLKSIDAGLYVCQMEWIYPPPYYSVMSSGTQLYVVDTEPCPVVYPYLWIPVTVVSGFLGYSILITIYIVTKVLRKSRHFTPGIYEKIIPV